MGNLNKKLLESLDRLDSYILNEARDDRLHVTIISGDENEDFIKANKRKIVDVYTDGPEGYFFTKGIPSGGYKYDNNDGYLSDEKGLDQDKIYLDDRSINKDYIVSELGLTKWDGTYRNFDGDIREFKWGEAAEEEKKQQKAERVREEEFATRLAEDLKNAIEKEIGKEVTYKIKFSGRSSYGTYDVGIIFYSSEKPITSAYYCTADEKYQTYKEIYKRLLGECRCDRRYRKFLS